MDIRCRVLGVGCGRVQGAGCRVQSAGCEVRGAKCGVLGFIAFQGSSMGSRVRGWGVRRDHKAAVGEAREKQMAKNAISARSPAPERPRSSASSAALTLVLHCTAGVPARMSSIWMFAIAARRSLAYSNVD